MRYTSDTWDEGNSLTRFTEEERVCEVCEGLGEVRPDGSDVNIPCDNCNGDGYIIEII